MNLQRLFDELGELLQKGVPPTTDVYVDYDACWGFASKVIIMEHVAQEDVGEGECQESDGWDSCEAGVTMGREHQTYYDRHPKGELSVRIVGDT